jgi:LysR family transcriptional regulator, regulator for bpeEF and oprC
MQQFMLVTQSKSFSVAARRLEISPSAISKVINGLEKALGFALFHRSTRHLSLTVPGAIYLERCREIFQALENAETEGRQRPQRPTGVVKVGLHPAFRVPFFGEIARLFDEYRELEVETRITNSTTVLLEEGFDVLIHAGALPDSNLIAHSIGWLERVVAATPRYLERHGTPMSPGDLEQHRVGLPARVDDKSTARWEFSRGNERCTVNLRSCLRLRDGFGLSEVVASGAVISRIYRIGVMRAINDGSVTPVLTDWDCPKDPAYAVFASARAITPKTRIVVDYVRQLVTASKRPEAVASSNAHSPMAHRARSTG